MTVLARGIILYRLDGGAARVLLLRDSTTGNWGFSKGRRDGDDRHEVDTARREVAEETGYGELDLHPAFRAESEYVVRENGTEYRKRVVYFLARAPDGEPTLSDEHDEHLWADVNQADAHLAYGQLRDLARSAFDAIARR